MVIECSECKGKVSTEARACPHCGAPVAPPSSPGGNRPAVVLAPKRSKKRLVVLVIVLAAVAVLGWYSMSPSGREGASQVVSSVLKTEKTLLDETFDVTPGSYTRYTVNLNREAKVTLTFAVREGPAVDVYLMDPSQVQEFEQINKRLAGGQFHFKKAPSRNAAREYTEGVVLPAGTYSFVLKSTQGAPLLGRGTPTKVYIKVTAQG